MIADDRRRKTMAEPTQDESLAAVWRRIIIGEQKSWVVLTNGTCVILVDAEGDLGEQACAIMKQYGPVDGGSSAADFSVIPLADHPGWVVTGHHPDVLNYVSPDIFAASEPSHEVVGMYGRTMRDADGRAPRVLHVEDRRNK